jgi:hypothetical protein
MTGEVGFDAIEDEVGAWHDSTGDIGGLHEWLGLTWEEYAMFAVQPAAFEQQMRQDREVGR